MLPPKSLDFTIQKATQLESIPHSLVDMFEPIGAQVYPSKVPGYNDEHVVYLLQTPFNTRTIFGICTYQDL